MPEIYIQIMVTIIGAGLTSYMGVRVALAEIRGDIKRHEERFAAMDRGATERANDNQRTHVDIDRRLRRLESVYFSRRREQQAEEAE